jgi:hypothetical protein
MIYLPKTARGALKWKSLYNRRVVTYKRRVQFNHKHTYCFNHVKSFINHFCFSPYSLDPVISYVPVQSFKLSTVTFTQNTEVRRKSRINNHLGFRSAVFPSP